MPSRPIRRRRQAASLKGRHGMVALLLVAFAMSATAQDAGDDKKEGGPSNPFGRWKEVRQARSALAAGRLAEAEELWERVLDTTSGQKERRAEALYSLALIHLTKDPDFRDLAAARSRLEELSEAFPQHDDKLAADALQSVVEDLTKAKADTEESREQVSSLADELVECRESREQAEGELADQETSKDKEVGALKKQVRALRGTRSELQDRIKELEAEVQRKTEALQRVTQTLVGGGGGG